MADTTLRLLLVGDDRSASKALKAVGDEADKTAGKVNVTTEEWGTRSKVSLAMFAEVADAVVAFGKSSVDAYRGAAKSQRELEDAYGRFPALQSVSIGKMRELNQAIQDKTGADADDIASSQAVLARYKLTGDQIADMTPLLVDYAARTGKDLPAAGSTLGKALAGNKRAMKELGIEFKDTGDPAKNFEQIMKGLKEKVGGFAEGEAQTLDGKLKRLSTKFGDVQEEVGEALVPALESLVDIASQAVDWISQNVEWLGPLAAGLGIAAGAAALLNAAMALNPFTLIVVGIGLLVAALIYAYNESETFRGIVDGAFKAVGAAGKWLWNNSLAPALRAIVNGFAWVTDGLAGMLEALGTIPGFEWAKGAAATLRKTAAGARELAGEIRDIPDADPQIIARDKATVTIREIDKKIKSLKGKVVEAKAKGDASQVKVIQGKINALQGKKVDIQAYLKKAGSWTLTASVAWAARVAGTKADGGIVRAMAAGGIGTPNIYSRSDGVMFNEPETMGEAYIPLANDWRRPRAISVWRETGKLIGAMAAGGINGAAASGGTSDTITINATVARGVDPLAFAREVEQSLVTLRQRKGGQPLAFQK